MSDPICEIAEALAVATSSCPATDVIMVMPTSANATSSVTPYTTPQGVLTDTANATNAVVIDAYALMINTAQATGDVSHTLWVTELAKSAGVAKSTAIQYIEQLAVSVANAEDEIAAADVPVMLTSAAHAVSTMVAGTIANLTVDSKAEATSSASLGLLEFLVAGANASSSITLLRRVDAFVTSTAEATDDAQPTGEPAYFLLLSVADAASVVSIDVEATNVITATAVAESSVWFSDPAAKAWMMNTETSAVGWYDNYGFESMTQVQGQTLAVGPDGLFVLDSDKDDGQRVDARVESGFTDWGAEQTKRLENMYFGYTSEGRISVEAEVYESGNSPAIYLLEERAANAPRNSRVSPGKGLWGRYWRLTIRNVDGADFEVHDASVDIAVSSRRI